MAELDGLRAIAVVAVVLFHSGPNGPFSGGFVGVDLFFVLSGFLITSILAERPSLASFYWRRFLRLAPPLMLMLAGYLLVAPFVWPRYDHARDALLALYVADYSYTFWRLPLYLQHTWSLAVEEQFYLLWPLVVVGLLKARRPALWLGAAYLVASLWRFPFVADWTSYYYRLDTHCTGLILGSLLAFWTPPKAPAWTGLGLLAVIILVGRISLAVTFIPFAELAAVMLICRCETVPLLRHRVLVAIGKLSYGIYLWHFPIAYAVRQEWGFVPTAMSTLATSTALAALSYVTVEAWSRRLRRGAFYPTSAAHQ